MARRSEGISLPSTRENEAKATAEKALATQRLQNFLADEVLHPTYTYGGTTTSQARRRVAERIQMFEQAFDNKAGAQHDTNRLGTIGL
jgi:hypothetical protein